MEPASIFGLIKGLFDAIRGVFGAVAPKLELTYEHGKPPYFERDDWTYWVRDDTDEEGNTISTTASSPRRWFRVGIKNRSLETVEDVRVELMSMEPDALGHLPLPLSIMHGTPQPLTVHRANEPTYFADVIIKVDQQERMHIMSPVGLTARSQGGIRAGRYRLGIRLTGRNTPAVTKHYIAAVDDEGRLTFAQD